MSAEGWNYADVFEAVARRFPDAPAQISDGRTLTWSDFDRRAGAVAARLVGAGLGPQSKVALFLYNGPEYLECVYGAFKASLVPVNTNYRYAGAELVHLWEDSDAEAVVFHADLADRVEQVRGQLTGVKLWVCVDAAGAVCPDWAERYEALAAAEAGPTGRERSGRDLLLLYTGGTTGRPKGVMWPQDSLFRNLEEGYGRDPDVYEDADARAQGLAKPGPRVLPAAPLMHGTALWFALPALGQGGCVVTVPDRSFQAASLLDTVVREEVKGLCIVGDAFGRPLVEALDAEPGRWDLTGLRLIFSSGVLFSAEVKQRLLAAAPRATLVDSIGTSESGGVARAQARAGEEPGAATFTVGPHTKVVAEDGTLVEPGSGERGRLAVGGSIPIGYYGDPEKTAETFVVVDGVTHVVAGDWCTVDADGSIRFLGRGSVCINTGGEKVYPEEVEEVIKRLPGVRDAVLLGVPDERFGEAVAAVVDLADGASVGPEDVQGAVRGSLAGYKVPRHVVFADVARQANGKLDYPVLREVVADALA